MKKPLINRTIRNCERLRGCEARRDKTIGCHDCILKDTCETKMKVEPNG